MKGETCAIDICYLLWIALNFGWPWANNDRHTVLWGDYIWRPDVGSKRGQKLFIFNLKKSNKYNLL